MLKAALKAVLPGKSFQALRSAYGRARMWWLRASFRPYEAKRRYAGREKTVYLPDLLAASWYDKDWDEPPEIAFLRSRGRLEGATVFDLGAHQGVMAMMLADAVGPSGRVVALDPLPHNAAAMERNFAANQAGNVVIVRGAAGEQPGEVRFDLRELNGQVSGTRGILVPVRTVDELAREHSPPDLVYIDVEGFECQVLRGAAHTHQSRPDYFVEAHVGHGLEKFGSTEELLRFFPPADYEVYVSNEVHPSFVPLEDGQGLMSVRFFLLAIARVPPRVRRS